MSLDWFGARFQPGSMDGQGSLKLLGAPGLDKIPLLVRETAQNSWDARLADTGLVYTLRLSVLDPSQLHTLRSEVFAHPGHLLNLESTLAREQLVVLEIMDRGTTGLGGPIRNDTKVPEGQSTDFMDFVLNVGAPRDTPMGGGTYGFGKTISYQMGGTPTIGIWSKPVDEPSSRFIASAIGSNFDLGGLRYTGRQWWGRLADQRIEPLVGAEADRLGSSLFSSSFQSGESGTSIMILDFCEPDEIESKAELLTEAAMWNLWPKVLPEPQRTEPAMRIRVETPGSESVLDPNEYDPLRPFVRSLQAVRSAQSGRDGSGSSLTSVHPIEVKRPRVTTGDLAISYAACGPEHDLPGSSDEEENELSKVRPVKGPARHYALMRQAELIVRYEAGPQPTNTGVCYGAVFRCREEVDDIFARSEPPAHDDWVPDALETSSDQTKVRTTGKRIKETLRDAVRGTFTPEIGDSASDQKAAAKVSAQLGDLVAAAESTGAGAANGSTRRGPRGSSRTTTSIVRTEDPIISIFEGGRAALVPIHVRDRPFPIQISFVGHILFEGGSERRSPDDKDFDCRGFQNGSVFSPSTRFDVLGSDLTIPAASGDSDWVAVVRLPDSLVVTVDFEYCEPGAKST